MSRACVAMAAEIECGRDELSVSFIPFAAAEVYNPGIMEGHYITLRGNRANIVPLVQK